LLFACIPLEHNLMLYQDASEQHILVTF